jgi:hypothetical protein
MLGLRPYRCSSCDHRFYVPMSLPKLHLGHQLAALLHELNPFRRVTRRGARSSRTLRHGFH